MHTLISSIIFYKLCSIATPGHPKPLLLGGHILSDRDHMLSHSGDQGSRVESSGDLLIKSSTTFTHSRTVAYTITSYYSFEMILSMLNCL